MKQIGLIILMLMGFLTTINAQKNSVMTGIEVLRELNFKPLEGKNVGLVTNHTAVDHDLISTTDILFSATEVKLKALFGPEHGIRGDFPAGEYVSYYIDKITGLPVYSLYGKTRKPDAEMLKGLDVIVYDIQDIGCRSYTYISTMGLVMEAAAENNVEVIILDRPNPLNGKRIEGNLVEDGYYSFVSQFKIPYVYGLTPGELASLLNNEGYLKDGIKCKLSVIKLEGWSRKMNFSDTGLPWVLTSPHIPHQYSSYYYPMTGMIGELTSVSIGVGYTLPFQTIAASWIEPDKFAQKMNSLEIPGVLFRPISYKPFYAMGKGEQLGGVEIYITDFDKCPLMSIQFYAIYALKELYPEKDIFKLSDQGRFNMFDKVCGTATIREKIEQNRPLKEILDYLNKDIGQFALTASKYYLYKD